MYRATVNATGQEIAVKKVDLEALGANLVGIPPSCCTCLLEATLRTAMA